MHGFFRLYQGTKYLSSDPHISGELVRQLSRKDSDGSNEGGNSVSNLQGRHFSGESLPITVHFNTHSSGERTTDRGVSPRDQSKGTTTQISSEGEVQNGGTPYRSLSSTQGRLYDETRSQGRLPSSDTPRVEEISSYQVRGKNLRVPLSPIRPLPGSPSLHQNPPSDCRRTAFRRDTNSHLPGRSSPDSPSERHICAETFIQRGFHSEPREMLSETNLSLKPPHTSRFFVGVNRTKICRDISLPHTSRFFVVINLV